LIEAPQKSRDIRYRADIDGLRAIAVLLVVAYHTGLQLPGGIALWVGRHISAALAARLAAPVAGGGFVGVDIFFVISGFLISGILLREQAAGSFSIVRFYERRVRRIFPALVAVLLFTFATGYFALIPSEMKDLAQSTLAATFSAANLYFWKTSNYFQPNALTKPLLHTWSLAVEEQFYVVFPVLLLLLHRVARRSLKLAIVLLALLSFAASAVGVYTRPGSTYYLPHTRAWELLAGTILALEIVPPPRTRLGRDLSSLIGLALVLFSGFVFTGTTPFPGAAALLPCAGAALLIAAGVTGPSLVGRLLSTPPFVFVGLISYSLYLWHWPLLLIDQYEYFPAVQLAKPWLLLAMFAVATLSWRFIEQPFRSGALRLPQRQLFVSAAVAVVLVSALSAWAVVSDGIPARFSPQMLALAQYPESGWRESQWTGLCFAYAAVPTIAPQCLAPNPGRPHFLLFGDSHAAHLSYGLTTAFPEIDFAQATASNCKPLLSSRASPDAYCRQLIATVFDSFLPGHPPDGVILSALWEPADAQPLAATVASLRAAGARVYVLGPSVGYDQALPVLLVKSIFRGDLRYPGRHLALTPSQYQAFDDLLAAAALGSGAYRYISLRQIMCSPAAFDKGAETSSCLEYASPGVPLQFDATHFTNAGSLLVAQRLRATRQLP
jgi:peptidoglycan/LPS O-acetylase OafA/YrhL